MEPILLTGKKELDIYVNPQRQNILRLMQIHGEPMTAKQIADQIGISASSVARHIRLLRELGIVEQSHTEQIHGITATYFRVLPRNVRVGGLKDDGENNQRIALMQADISQRFAGFVSYCEALGDRMSDENQFGDMISGITYLKPSEAKELYHMIRSFLDAHENHVQDSDAWEFAIIGYPVEHETHE
ncbi:MAG: ArsR family transcriptional regulator [Christensenella sp.]|nr:ArsR family transcriptional regulator [Christensenella sp.]